MKNSIDNNENYNETSFFYSVNSDFSGSRDVGAEHQENVEFLSSSSIRIWYNDLSTDFDIHCHNAVEIIMPVENYYDVEAQNVSFRIMPKELIIIPPGMLHSLTAPKCGVRFIYLIDISNIVTLKGFSGIQPLLSQPLYITKDTYPNIYDDIYGLLVRMRNEYFSRNEFYELTIHSLLINIFIKLGQDRVHTEDLFPNVRIDKQKEYVQKFNDLLSYIDMHYMEDLNLEDIAASVGFSKYHFSRLFKQYTKFTFCDYLCYRRIKAAEELLVKPDLSITEVALQAGFPSISTFNRLFKQSKKCTPSEYRTKNHKILIHPDV